MYMIGDEVVHNGQTYVSLINYNDCALDNYLAWRIKKKDWRIKKKERNCGAKISLIDVDALRKNYQEICSDIACISCPFLNEDGCALEQMIRYAPTIEAEPVKRGRWEPHPSEREWDICSYCHLGTKRREYGLNDDGTEWVTEQSYIHCPWCGAKLEGAEE